jgi:uncharacterized delta-60 repeat protein
MTLPPLLAMLIACQLNLAASAQASPGDLDPAFGTGGKVSTPFAAGSAGASAMIAQPDGKLVVAGGIFTEATGNDFSLARYNPDGSLDPSFGTDGVVATDFGRFPPSDVAEDLARQPDGKLVVAGWTFAASGDEFEYALARYNSDGTLDPAFGTGGLVTTHFMQGQRALALAVQTDGKLVVAGIAANGSEQVFSVVRYNADGTLDPTFGTGGVVTTDFPESIVLPSDVVIQNDGRIVVAGSVLVDSSGTFPDFDLALIRYQPDGRLDQSFGRKGKVTTDFSRDDTANALALQADGKLVVAGSVVTDASGPAPHFDFVMARFKRDGNLDRTFGHRGRTITDLTGPGNSDVASALAVQADGKLVAAGMAFVGGVGTDFALARYETNGNLDPSFGTAGTTTTDFANSEDAATAVVVAPDSGLVAAGTTSTGTTSAFALARYTTN